MITIKGGKLPILSWCKNPEKSCVEQAINLANHPALIQKVCLMPDAHMGYGMPIGGVIAVKDGIIPNAVGVDIGCGMLSIKTNLTTEDLPYEILEKISEKIHELIPMGQRRHQDMCPVHEIQYDIEFCPIVNNEFGNARRQLGTLGGGNHFIEIQKDEKNSIWIMIHSGSRNIGKKIGEYYNNQAKDLNERWFSKIPKEHDLAFIPATERLMREYLQGMRFCTKFAEGNRNKIAQKTMEIVTEITKKGISKLLCFHTTHNYAEEEEVASGTWAWVHRKGAISTRTQDNLAIPGSQGTQSYIVKTKNSTDAMYSASHGAGRAMGRKQAIRELSIEQELKKMEDKKIVHRMLSSEDLDEAPGAYKNIDEVMESQKDLVEITEKLTPLMSAKG